MWCALAVGGRVCAFINACLHVCASTCACLPAGLYVSMYSMCCALMERRQLLSITTRLSINR